jgi:hypothetical protein
MGAQIDMFDLREERRPLRTVIAARHVTETQWALLLDCGHSLENVNHSEANAKRKRCTTCGMYGADVGGLKFKIPEQIVQ